jgi:3-oxoacid CoA-transferase A subunit
MINKLCETIDQAVADIPDGAILLVGGFGAAGVPENLLTALLGRDVKDLTIVANNTGSGDETLGLLFKADRVKKVYASFPVPAARRYSHFKDSFNRSAVELELVPQGTLAERLRAAGAGLAGFYTPTGVGTAVAEGKDLRYFDGKPFVLERALHGDFALLRAHQGDRYGNLRFRKAARNFNPVMAMAAKFTIAEVEEIVDPGTIDPDDVHTAGIFVDRVVQAKRMVTG